MIETQKKDISAIAAASIFCGLISLVNFVNIYFVKVDNLMVPAIYSSYFDLVLLICSLLAVILGINALIKISKKTDTLKGKGFAIAGIVLGGLALAYRLAHAFYSLILMLRGYDA